MGEWVVCSFLLLKFPSKKKNKAFLNDVVGLNFTLSQSSVHANQKQQFINTINMWSVLDPRRTPPCNTLVKPMRELQQQFDKLNFLERCEDQVDFEEFSRKLENFYDEGWKRRGWELLYKRKEGEGRKKEKLDCFVVKKEWLQEAKEIGREYVQANLREGKSHWWNGQVSLKNTL